MHHKEENVTAHAPYSILHHAQICAPCFRNVRWPKPKQELLIFALRMPSWIKQNIPVLTSQSVWILLWMLIVRINQYSWCPQVYLYFVQMSTAGEQRQFSWCFLCKSESARCLLNVWSWHCVSGRVSSGQTTHYFDDKNWASFHHPCTLHMYLISSPHQRCRAGEIISMIKSLLGAYTAMSARHLNTKATPLPSLLPTPTLPLPAAFTLLVSYAFQHKEESTTQGWPRAA